MFYTLLTQPLTNALVFFYNTIALEDLGLSIIFLTLAIRVLLYPLFHKSARYQMIMQKIQPKLKEVQKAHKEDKVKQTEAMMALYKEHNVNPFSGILFLVIQIPILLALYRIFLTGLTSESFTALYSFVARPAELHTTFLGLLNLTEKSILMVVLAAILQYVQGWLMVRKQKSKDLTPMEQMGRRMVFMGPLITLLIFTRLPAAVSLYWVVSTAVSVIQQIVIERHLADKQIANSK